MSNKIVVAPPKDKRLVTDHLERAKIKGKIILDMLSEEVITRLADDQQRAAMSNKDLADYWDKFAKALLPRDVRVRVADPETLQLIVSITVTFLEDAETARQWLTEVTNAMKGSAIMSQMANTGAKFEDIQR